MKVDFINYPFVYTDDGKRLNVSQFDTQPRVGNSIEEYEPGKLKVLSNANDSDCVGGACPVV